MRSAFDPESVRRTLEDGLKKGYWTIEHLDHPPLGSEILMNDLSKSPDPNLRILANKPHRNLLRDYAYAELSEDSPAAEDSFDPTDF